MEFLIYIALIAFLMLLALSAVAPRVPPIIITTASAPDAPMGGPAPIIFWLLVLIAITILFSGKIG